ncbi:hypothetical protein ACFLTH_03585 [Bacteroidota bacterium]
MSSSILQNTESVISLIRQFDIDIYGFAKLTNLKGIPTGIPDIGKEYFKQFPYAILLGVQWRKFGNNTSGEFADLFLEKAALKLSNYVMEERGFSSLVIHPEDEFDQKKRIGLLSLKVLAKAAGLGWQGRSLLTVSPKYGPLHRLIGILTDMPLQTNEPIQNQCGECRDCVDQCPVSALTYVEFDDHPENREDVLDITVCLGDNACTVCIESCPWLR